MVKQTFVGSIVGWPYPNNDIFLASSPRNRDDCLEPYRHIKEKFALNRIEIHTPDLLQKQGVTSDFSLYIDTQKIESGISKKYFINLEPPLISPLSSDISYLKNFDLIFTWNKKILEQSPLSGKAIEIRLPNPIPQKILESGDTKFRSVRDREFKICMLNSNKAPPTIEKVELYSERVKIIRWLEKNLPDKFALFGPGWEKPSKVIRGTNIFLYKIEKLKSVIFNKKPFSSHLGTVETKREVLSNSRFAVCFENSRGPAGYISEKIFDCFFSGCVPIYLGDPNVSSQIPKESFIAADAFTTYEDLFEFVLGMTDEDYESYQIAASKFLQSKEFLPFSSEAFATTIVTAIKNDLLN